MQIDTGIVQERHRHRYEVNPKYVKNFESWGLNFIGRDETGQRMEIMEYRNHPFFVGTQYHPEYLSRPLKPSPAFLEDLSDSEIVDEDPALKQIYEQIKLDLPWIETQSITTSKPVNINDVDNDLEQGAIEGREKVIASGVPFTRPDDYFAEMIKSKN
ncbi:6011_t:CDS:2 [Entrophospora sp. SA101]|nr:6011_t:CDS:2 [Entrophospora sp. SA101]